MHVIFVVAITERGAGVELIGQPFVARDHSDDSRAGIKHCIFFVDQIEKLFKLRFRLGGVNDIQAPLDDVLIRYFVHGKFVWQISND